MTIHIPAKFVRQFKKLAKELYPLEAFVICLGRSRDDVFFIEDFYVPDDMSRVASPDTVCTVASVYVDWWVEAKAKAQEEGLEILGDIHSHPYSHKEEVMAHPSEVDWDATFAGGFQGILAIQKRENGRFWSKLRFWPARADVDVVVE